MLKKSYGKFTEKSSSPQKEKSKAKKSKLIREAENEPGPSHINLVNDSQDDESDMETEITDEQKCCVCKKYTPDEVRYSVSVIFTKWVKCGRVVVGELIEMSVPSELNKSPYDIR